MSIASEITRLQGVKSDILQAISDKGVTVPAGSMLDDCPDLIASIPTGNDDILLVTNCDNIANDVDVPLIGDNSVDLTTFNYTNLNPGFSVNCDSLTASYGGVIPLYDLSSTQFNFKADICFSESTNGTTFNTFGFKLGPFYIYFGDPFASPSVLASSLCIMLNQVASDFSIDTNIAYSNYTRNSGGSLYVKFDSLSNGKLHNFRFIVDDNRLYAKDFSSGLYFSMNRQYLTATWATKVLFGTLSAEKKSSQSASIYSVNVVKL